LLQKVSHDFVIAAHSAEKSAEIRNRVEAQ